MVPDYLPSPKWWHLKKMNRILNTCTNRKITGEGDIFISSIISIRKWKKTSHRCSHSSLWVFHAGDPWSYRGNAASRLLKWYSWYIHPLPTWTLTELFSSWSSKRNKWECKQISGGEMVIPPARRVMISWSSSMHLYSYATYICFSPCSLLQWRDSTLHTLMTIHRVSMSFLK